VLNTDIPVRHPVGVGDPNLEIEEPEDSDDEEPTEDNLEVNTISVVPGSSSQTEESIEDETDVLIWIPNNGDLPRKFWPPSALVYQAKHSDCTKY
jgi:hypothetical protein